MGKVEGGMKCVKYLLFVFNFIFWLMGSLVLSVGLWLRFDPETVSLLNGAGAPETFFIGPQRAELHMALTVRTVTRIEHRPVDTQLRALNSFHGVYILIVAGSLVMLVGFFGCCGAVRESQCLLGSFFACLLIIFGAEVAAGVFGFLNKDKIIEDVQNFYAKTYNDDNNSTLIASYHKVLNCCGTKAVPCSDSLSESKDCEAGIEEFFNSKLYIIGYVGIGIAGVMIIGMIFSMVLCCAIRNSREVI